MASASSGLPLRSARHRIVRRQGGLIGFQRTTAPVSAFSNRSKARLRRPADYRFVSADYRFRPRVFESFEGIASASSGVPVRFSGRPLPSARISNRSEARHRLPADNRFVPADDSFRQRSLDSMALLSCWRLIRLCGESLEILPTPMRIGRRAAGQCRNDNSPTTRQHPANSLPTVLAECWQGVGEVLASC